MPKAIMGLFVSPFVVRYRTLGVCEISLPWIQESLSMALVAKLYNSGIHDKLLAEDPQRAKDRDEVVNKLEVKHRPNAIAHALCLASEESNYHHRRDRRNGCLAW